MPSLETAYRQMVGSDHRKAWGQFFTPPPVARFMARWVAAAGAADLYDPAFGLGAFLDAMPADFNGTFAGSEVDNCILDYWRAAHTGRPATVRREDYLFSWGRQHSGILGNPPYMRFQRFPNRPAVFDQFARQLNLKLPGYTNIASAFLLKSLSELASGGRLAYLMPLEFLNTGYGKLVKEQLIADRHLYALIRLDCEREVIPDAVTSLGIILYDKATRFSGVNFHTAAALQDLDSLLHRPPAATIPYAQLDAQDKWLPCFAAAPLTPDYASAVPLAHYGHFRRGIATGANRFFALRPSQARAAGLTAAELTPVIAKSAQIQKPFFSPADYAGLLQADSRALLFNVNGNLSPAAERYIQSGERQGFHQGYITGHRHPWYKNETRQPAPLLLGVFSRGGYKIIRNTSAALNLTCFHGFQPNSAGQSYLERLFLYFQSRPGRELVSLSLRKYVDSLDKFEPNDLNGALTPAPGLLDSIPAAAVAAAMRQLRTAGQLPPCVDSWFAKLTR